MCAHGPGSPPPYAGQRTSNAKLPGDIAPKLPRGLRSPWGFPHTGEVRTALTSVLLVSPCFSKGSLQPSSSRTTGKLVRKGPKPYPSTLSRFTAQQEPKLPPSHSLRGTALFSHRFVGGPGTGWLDKPQGFQLVSPESGTPGGCSSANNLMCDLYSHRSLCQLSHLLGPRKGKCGARAPSDASLQEQMFAAACIHESGEMALLLQAAPAIFSCPFHSRLHNVRAQLSPVTLL